MTITRVPMTEFGIQQLREELQRLKTIDRPIVIEAIARAREHGDLKENAEYHAAREQQGFIEGRIADIEHKLAHAHVVDLSNVQQDGKIIVLCNSCIYTLPPQSELSVDFISNGQPITMMLDILMDDPLKFRAYH